MARYKNKRGKNTPSTKKTFKPFNISEVLEAGRKYNKNWDIDTQILKNENKFVQRVYQTKEMNTMQTGEFQYKKVKENLSDIQEKVENQIGKMSQELYEKYRDFFIRVNNYINKKSNRDKVLQIEELENILSQIRQEYMRLGSGEIESDNIEYYEELLEIAEGMFDSIAQ